MKQRKKRRKKDHLVFQTFKKMCTVFQFRFFTDLRKDSKLQTYAFLMMISFRVVLKKFFDKRKKNESY